MADCEPNVHQFMDLTVPEYAYMFGFLQADGHLQQGVGQKGTPYNSSISERTRSTNFSETVHSAVWTLCSLEARTRLNELGLPYGRKSKTIAPPRVEFSRRDCVRGVIDADGSVGFTRPGLPFISLTTASTAIGAYLCFYAREITGAERNIKHSLATWVRPAGMKVVSHRRWKTWEDRVLLEHSNAASAAEALDRTVQSCSLRLWHLRTGQVPMPSGV